MGDGGILKREFSSALKLPISYGEKLNKNKITSVHPCGVTKLYSLHFKI
jgi:hypothetical protein